MFIPWRRTKRSPTDDEIARELRDHLELEAADAAAGSAAGTAIDAAHVARRAFGNPTLIAETVRDGWRWIWWEQLVQDVRHSVRALRRAPVYTVTAAVTLALGIGATTTVFSMIDAIYRHPFPRLPQDRLVWVTQPSKSCVICNSASPAAYHALSTAHSLRGVAATDMWSGSMRTGMGSDLIEGYRVTPSTFDVIEAPFALGRGFSADVGRHGPSNVLVLSYNFWQRRFAGSRSVLDSAVTIGGEPYRIIGVLGEHVVFPTATDVYLPLVLSVSDLASNARYVELFGRLASGATTEDARREAAVITKRLAATSSNRKDDSRIAVRPLSHYHTDDVKSILQLIAIAAALVLLAATISVANLALARGTVRRHELTLRAALGGRRVRLLRLLLAEALLVAIPGGAVGLLLAAWWTRAVRGAVPTSLARYLPGYALMRVDARTLWFSIAVSLFVTVLFALLPALRATSARLSEVLADAGRGASGGTRSTRLRSAIVIAEVSVALALLSTAALMGRSVHNMLNGDPGVRLDHLLTMNLSLPATMGDSAARDFVRRLDERLHAVPGVRGAALVSNTPLSNNSSSNWFEVPGRPPESDGAALSALDQRITPDYFRTAGMRILSGRAIAARDDASAARVVVISKYMSERLWPGVDPVGRTIVVNRVPWTIVGVVSDVRHLGYQEPLSMEIYRSILQAQQTTSDINVWTEADPDALRDPVRRAIAEIDPDAGVGQVMTMRELEARHLSAFKVLGNGLGLFAGVTLVIAIVGLYGLVAYGVAQRRREIGIRMALGATRRMIVAHITRGALGLTLTGVVVGGAIGVALCQLLRSLLYGVSASDPRTPLAVAALLVAVTLAAAIIPAWRAMRVSPAMALRD